MYRTDEVPEDPQAKHLQLFVDTNHPTMGPSRTVRSPISFDGQRNLHVTPPPTLGEHNALYANGWPEADLADVIYRYGEEKRSRAVAKAIVAGRPWKDTRTLAEAVAKVVCRGTGRIHPATRTFQAIRIWVNRELEGLDGFITRAAARLAPGGRLVMLTFHSLEDRVVKHTFRALQAAMTRAGGSPAS